MPISPYYKPINQVRSEIDADNAQSFGLGLDPSLGTSPMPSGASSQFDLGIDPSLPGPTPQAAPDDVTSHQAPPPPAMDDNQILQKYMRQKYPDAFSKGQGQVAANQVTRQDIDNLRNNSDLDAITSAFSKAAAGAGSVGGKAAESNYGEIAKADQAADANALKSRMELTNQGENMQQNAIKGLDALDNQSYQASLRPLEQQAKQQALDKGALGLQTAESDFRNKEALNDANSPQSQALRKIAKSFNMNVTDDMSGSQLSELIPIAEKAFNASENRASRLDVAKQRAEQTNILRKDKEDVRKERQSSMDDAKLNKRFTEAYKELDGMKGRTGPLGKAVERVMNANAVDVMIKDNNGVLQNLTNTQLQELAIGVNKMLGGSEAHGAIEALVPKNINMNATAIRDWLTSEPNGTNQQKFVELMAHTLDRERELAKATIKSSQIKKLKGYRDLAHTDPERFQQILVDNEITPEQFEKGIDPITEARRTSNEKSQTTGVTTSKGRNLYVPGQKAGGH